MKHKQTIFFCYSSIKKIRVSTLVLLLCSSLLQMGLVAFANEGDQADNKITTQVKNETISQPQIPIKTTIPAVTTKSDIEDLTVDQEGIIGRDEQKRVPDTTKDPFRKVVRLFMYFPDGVYYGSGTMIAPNLILTAAHNVYNEETNQWASRVQAVPAQNGLFNKPYQSYVADNYFILNGYQNGGHEQYDMAVIKLEKNVPENVGSLEIEKGVAVGQQVQVVGYPADTRYKRSYMYTMSGKIEEVEGKVFKYQMDTETGQSGGPVLNDKNKIVGVHISGYEDDSGSHYVNNGARIVDEDTEHLIEVAKNDITDEHVASYKKVTPKVTTTEVTSVTTLSKDTTLLPTTTEPITKNPKLTMTSTTAITKLTTKEPETTSLITTSSSTQASTTKLTTTVMKPTTSKEATTTTVKLTTSTEPTTVTERPTTKNPITTGLTTTISTVTSTIEPTTTSQATTTVTQPTTKPTTSTKVPTTTQSSTKPTTATKAPTTKASTQPTTITKVTTTSKSTTKMPTTSQATTVTKPTTKSSTKVTVTTKASTKPTTKATTKRTTKATTKNTTKPSVKTEAVYRLYHAGIKRHLYTKSAYEAKVLSSRGWNFEGEKFRTVSQGTTPVYRLYHSGTREHLYTTSTNERDTLKTRSWRYEGIAWYSTGKKPIYRLYHAGLKVHLYTADANEKNTLSKRGWKYEGISFYVK